MHQMPCHSLQPKSLWTNVSGEKWCVKGCSLLLRNGLVTMTMVTTSLVDCLIASTHTHRRQFHRKYTYRRTSCTHSQMPCRFSAKANWIVFIFSFHFCGFAAVQSRCHTLCAIAEPSIELELHTASDIKNSGQTFIVCTLTSAQLHIRR